MEYIIENTMSPQNLSNPMTVVALVNGMIGGIILVMPIMALKTGTALIAPLVIVSGFFSFFSCLLIVRHLSCFKDVDQAIYHHFGQRRSFKVFYDLTIIIGMGVLLILYFGLICKQWQGITTKSHLIPILNAIVLFPIVYVMKKFNFGASLLAYGILSIIGYCMFLAWMLATAPKGDNKVEVADDHFSELGAALSLGFAIQTFFIPILKQNPNSHFYKRLLIITFLLGTSVYTYIGYSGAFSLVNREHPGDEEPETIEQYFQAKEWEVILLQIIYLVHLYSAFPQFLLISKERFFSILKWPEPEGVSFKEVVYVGVFILIALIIKLTNISVETLINVCGSIVSFVFVNITPIGLHVKCIYFPNAFPPKHSNELEDAKGDQDREEQKEEGEKQIELKTVTSENKIEKNCKGPVKYTCDVHFRSKAHEYCEMGLMIIMVIVGAVLMVYTLVLVGKDSKQ